MNSEAVAQCIVENQLTMVWKTAEDGKLLMLMHRADDNDDDDDVMCSCLCVHKQSMTK